MGKIGGFPFGLWCTHDANHVDRVANIDDDPRPGCDLDIDNLNTRQVSQVRNQVRIEAAQRQGMGGIPHHTTPHHMLLCQTDPVLTSTLMLWLCLCLCLCPNSLQYRPAVLHHLGANPVQRVFTTFCIELAPRCRFPACPCLHCTAIQPREVSSMNLRGMAAESP